MLATMQRNWIIHTLLVEIVGRNFHMLRYEEVIQVYTWFNLNLS